MIKIRGIKEQDDVIMESIIKHSLETHGLDQEGTAYTDPQLSALTAHYTARPLDKYWVIELDSEVVGGIGIGMYDQEKEICELQKLYLAPKALGKGLANELMKTALSYASVHFKRCYLETRHELEAASKLYEKYGFERLDAPLEGSNHSAMDRWYIKDLQ
ncbi:GNAT family N-acetyltransferase [Oceanobacillus sp. J11TS1]|uniref:GNAT family N-acetyltransferase n=1 Tax=Oceanobacillus sp. J11TS1 TaxID=2807191 RepID=UPI001B2B205E|nr:N-acetyltransferase [Oceanobacillus sp. J11TS1]